MEFKIQTYSCPCGAAGFIAGEFAFEAYCPQLADTDIERSTCPRADGCEFAAVNIKYLESAVGWDEAYIKALSCLGWDEELKKFLDELEREASLLC